MNIGREKTNEFLNRIEKLIASVDNSHVVTDSAGKKYNEKDYLRHLVTEARNLVDHGEWLIALENILDNLHGINYKLDINTLNLAESALLATTDDNVRIESIKLMKLQDDIHEFKKYLERGLHYAQDGLLRRVHFDYNNVRNSAKVEISVDSNYGWINLEFQFGEVEEFCFKQKRNYTDVVLSSGIRADKINDLFYFDFSPWTDNPEDIEDYRKSTCYVGCRKFSLYYKKYEDNE